jgi:hypothetical protein
MAGVLLLLLSSVSAPRHPVVAQPAAQREIHLSTKKRKKGATQNVRRPSALRTPRWQIVAAIAAILIAYAALRLPGISVPLDRLAAFVAAATTPADPVFIMGSEPQILFYAERRSPSTFLMIYPLTSTYPRYKEFQETVWREIQKTPPKLILDAAAIPTSILWDESADLDIMDHLRACQ